MSQLEKDIEKKLKLWAKARGIICIKYTPQGEKGWPDRIFVLPRGTHVWLELKRKGEEPTPLQYYRLEQLRDQGAIAYWSDCWLDACDYLLGHIEATR